MDNRVELVRAIPVALLRVFAVVVLSEVGRRHEYDSSGSLQQQYDFVVSKCLVVVVVVVVVKVLVVEGVKSSGCGRSWWSEEAD